MLWFSEDVTTLPILLKLRKVSVNGWASVCEVPFIPLLQKLNRDGLEEIKEVLYLRGGQGLTQKPGEFQFEWSQVSSSD